MAVNDTPGGQWIVRQLRDNCEPPTRPTGHPDGSLGDVWRCDVCGTYWEIRLLGWRKISARRAERLEKRHRVERKRP